MDFPLSLLDALKYVVSLCALLGGLVPGSEELKTSERGFVVLAVVLPTLAWWPVDVSYCRYTNGYFWGAVGCFFIFILTHIGDQVIIKRFQVSVDIDGTLTKVIGGPKLTAAAHALRQAYPEKEVFRRLNYEVSQMWEPGPRSWLVNIHHFLLRLPKRIALLLAIISICACGTLRYEVNKQHRALKIDPSEETIVLAGNSLEIRPDFQECDARIDWDVVASEKVQRLGLQGEVKDGLYFPPEQVHERVEVYVVATPHEHPYERKRLKIEVRRPPDYTTPYQVEGKDPQGKRAQFRIDIIDDTYSWIIGKNELHGVKGQSFVQKMASDGMFNGFDDVICIGAASREYITAPAVGILQLKSIEENRALDRAVALGTWVRNAVGSRRLRIHTLKVGRYDDEARLSPELTASERRVVIVGVRNAERGVILKEALRNAFAQKRAEEPLLGMYLDKYPESQWVLEHLGTLSGQR